MLGPESLRSVAKKTLLETDVGSAHQLLTCFQLCSAKTRASSVELQGSKAILLKVGRGSDI